MRSYRDLGFDDNFRPSERRKREYVSGINSDTFLEGVDSGQILTSGQIMSPRNSWQLGFNDETGGAEFRGKLKTGTLIAGNVNVGGNAVQMDGINRRIIINDGDYDRILLGEQDGGF